MKTAEELREMLKGIFDEETEAQRAKADARCPREMNAETLAVHNAVMKDLEGLIRDSLKPKALYCVPMDDFYDNLRKMMTHQLYVTYPTYEVAEGVTDEQIFAHRADIESGNIPALEHLRKTPCGTNWTGHMGTAYLERRRMFNNLFYYLYMMAHLAKRYGSRLAAEKFLRAGSIARKGLDLVPRNLSEDAASELIELTQEGVDELKVAADYFALPEWEGFRAREAEKFAAAEAQAAAEEAKKGKG